MEFRDITVKGITSPNPYLTHLLIVLHDFILSFIKMSL